MAVEKILDLVLQLYVRTYFLLKKVANLKLLENWHVLARAGVPPHGMVDIEPSMLMSTTHWTGIHHGVQPASRSCSRWNVLYIRY